MVRIRVSSGLTKKQRFCSWLAQDLYVGKIILLFVRFIVNVIHFLKCIFSLVFYVIMFLSFEGSDEEKIITIIIFFIN